MTTFKLKGKIICQLTMPQKDMRFIVKNLLGLDSIRALPGYEDCSDELFDSVLRKALNLLQMCLIL